MAEKINDGGPAYPLAHTPETDHWSNEGMSLRDHFAGQALAGLLASAFYTNNDVGFEEFISQKAYATADAMLATRSSSMRRDRP